MSGRGVRGGARARSHEEGAGGLGRPAGIWAVDRIESGVAVLVRDDDERVAEVPKIEFPTGTREGSVLRVPEPEGNPDWGNAVLDEELRRERLREAEEVLQRLRRRDPGGDVVL